MGEQKCPKEGNRPNIIIIQCDSMDGRVMGCMGHTAAHTPNLDRLASKGVLFKNAYTNSPQCCPSRASMWSGKYVHTIEAWNNYKGLSEEDKTFFSELSQNGYNVKAFGKTDYLSGYHSLGNRIHAWTRSLNINYEVGRPSAEIIGEDTEIVNEKDWQAADESIQWLKEANEDKSRPFALYYGIRYPHPPFRTSGRWLNAIDRGKITVPPYEERLHPCIEYSSRCKNTFGSFSNDEIVDIRRCYYAMVAEVDALVGRLMDAVYELGIQGNTYIIFTSDHGEMNMEHRLQLKNSMYEASARVPLIISGPGAESGAAVEDLCSLIDIYPTLMDIANIPAGEDLQGASLMPELTGRKSSGRQDWVLSEYHSNFLNTGCFMLRKGKWKYIAYAGYEGQLFDLESDPEELDNLIQERPDVAGEMDSILISIVDYEVVDKKVKEYDRESFLKWRNGLSNKEYIKLISKAYKNQNPEYLTSKIEEWLVQVHAPDICL